MALSAALAGFACWGLVAGTGCERLAFTGVLRGFANPPFLVSGKGTCEVAWAVRTRAEMTTLDVRKVPVVVSIGDDPDGVFQSLPPSPVDLAVVLKNLQRLGAKQAAIAMVLAWENPDAVALKGLDLVLNDFQKVIQATPLARGTVGQAMPPALRRASLPLELIQGDKSKLPLINRVAVSEVIFGGENVTAGFSFLDGGDSGCDKLPLLARWEDEERVVLAFPLLAVLARYDLPLSGVQVKLGEFIQLGPAGPVVVIDQDGRMLLPRKAMASRAYVAAAALIDGAPDLLPDTPGLIVVRDDQSNAPHATREFSAMLTSAIAAIGSDAGLGPSNDYRRLSKAWEVSLLMLVGMLLTVMAGWPRFQVRLGIGILAALAVAGQWLALGMAQVWLPGMPVLAAILAGGVVIFLLGKLPLANRQPTALPVAGRRLERVGLVIPATGRFFRSVTMRRGPDGIHEVKRRGASVGDENPLASEALTVASEVAPDLSEVIQAVDISTQAAEEEPVPTKARRKAAHKASSVRKKRR